MNETADPNVQILLVAIIAFYWALLGSWGELQPRPGEEKPKARDSPTAGRIEQSQDISAEVLGAIRETDLNFHPRRFLAGAKAAYEIVLLAYACGEIQILKRFVGPDVFDTFELAIAERRKRGEILLLTLIGIREATIVDAVAGDEAAEIVVRFISDVIIVTRAADDSIVTGDPLQAIEVIDAWTFSCDIRSGSHKWKLIATDN